MANGIIFLTTVFLPGQPATLRAVFGFDVMVLLLLCPAVTMRSICEERRLGTFELLAASPAGSSSLVVGKFMAAFASLATMLVPTLVLVLLLELYGRPDPGEVLAGYLGLLLVGSMYLAGGLLASTIAGSQTIAYLLSVFFFILVSLSRTALPAWVGPDVWGVLSTFDPFLRMEDFTIGLIDTSSIVYFLVVTGWFLLAAVAVIETERRS
ncbi:MAG: ABC transporter permease [Phycisphaerales bacterium]|nr:ABC transporter permease [Phycisphaerales bacterium]